MSSLVPSLSFNRQWDGYADMVESTVDAEVEYRYIVFRL